MSIRASSAVWNGVTYAAYAGGTLVVLLALADWADDDGLCWPSVQKIAGKARLGVRQVHKILDQLRTDGAISVETPGGGRGVTTRYRLSMNSDSVNSKTVNSSSQKPCTPVLKTVNSSSENGEISDSAIRKNRQYTSRATRGTVMVRPTLEQVSAYCAERGNNVDPQTWLDHYISNGWKVGRNAMQDWKASIRTWERGEYPAAHQKRAGVEVSGTLLTDDDLVRRQ